MLGFGVSLIGIPKWALKRFSAYLGSFIVDYRPPFGSRIAAHFYNTIDEVDAVMAEMKKIKEGN